MKIENIIFIIAGILLVIYLSKGIQKESIFRYIPDQSCLVHHNPSDCQLTVSCSPYGLVQNTTPSAVLSVDPTNSYAIGECKDLFVQWTCDMVGSTTTYAWIFNCIRLTTPPSTPVTPPSPQIPSFNSILSKIIDWLRGLWDWLTSKSIIGMQTVAPNSQHTYVIEVSAQVPNSNYSSGSVQYQYGNWALLDSNANILQQGNWENVSGFYSKAITITTPAQLGKYVLIGVIYQYDMKYNNNVWSITNQDIVGKEALDIQTGLPIPSNPALPSFSSFISNIFNWLRGLFSWLFK